MSYLDPQKQKQYQVEYMRRRRQEYFRDKSCVKCGSVNNLELDHINPQEKISHRIWSWSKVRREIELTKCQVLCKSCHIAKTNERFPKRAHGTLVMYRKGNCRCPSCKAAQAEAMREYRNRKWLI